MVSYLIRRIKSFGYALEGIAYTIKYHPSILIQLFATFVVVVLGLTLDIKTQEWVALLLTIFMVLTTELINTAIEVTLDHMTKDHHLRVKYAKDVAAGAVLIMSIGSVIIGWLIFLPYLSNLLFIYS
ncbi:diacylglycerol kinase family protein [candidate division WWE3 bacterium]|nr:diacylglycerol kinase family protein [candidate division WWE3 bacterium]